MHALRYNNSSTPQTTLRRGVPLKKRDRRLPDTPHHHQFLVPPHDHQRAMMHIANRSCRTLSEISYELSIALQELSRVVEMAGEDPQDLIVGTGVMTMDARRTRATTTTTTLGLIACRTRWEERIQELRMEYDAALRLCAAAEASRNVVIRNDMIAAVTDDDDYGGEERNRKHKEEVEAEHPVLCLLELQRASSLVIPYVSVVEDEGEQTTSPHNNSSPLTRHTRKGLCSQSEFGSSSCNPPSGGGAVETSAGSAAQSIGSTKRSLSSVARCYTSEADLRALGIYRPLPWLRKLSVRVIRFFKTAARQAKERIRNRLADATYNRCLLKRSGTEMFAIFRSFLKGLSFWRRIALQKYFHSWRTTVNDNLLSESRAKLRLRLTMNDVRVRRIFLYWRRFVKLCGFVRRKQKLVQEDAADASTTSQQQQLLHHQVVVHCMELCWSVALRRAQLWKAWRGWRWYHSVRISKTRDTAEAAVWRMNQTKRHAFVTWNHERLVKVNLTLRQDEILGSALRGWRGVVLQKKTNAETLERCFQSLRLQRMRSALMRWRTRCPWSNMNTNKNRQGQGSFSPSDYEALEVQRVESIREKLRPMSRMALFLMLYTRTATAAAPKDERDSERRLQEANSAMIHRSHRGGCEAEGGSSLDAQWLLARVHVIQCLAKWKLWCRWCSSLGDLLTPPPPSSSNDVSSAHKRGRKSSSSSLPVPAPRTFQDRTPFYARSMAAVMIIGALSDALDRVSSNPNTRRNNVQQSSPPPLPPADVTDVSAVMKYVQSVAMMLVEEHLPQLQMLASAVHHGGDTTSKNTDNGDGDETQCSVVVCPCTLKEVVKPSSEIARWVSTQMLSALVHRCGYSWIASPWPRDHPRPPSSPTTNEVNNSLKDSLSPAFGVEYGEEAPPLAAALSYGEALQMARMRELRSVSALHCRIAAGHYYAEQSHALLGFTPEAITINFSRLFAKRGRRRRSNSRNGNNSPQKKQEPAVVVADDEDRRQMVTVAPPIPPPAALPLGATVSASLPDTSPHKPIHITSSFPGIGGEVIAVSVLGTTTSASSTTTMMMRDHLLHSEQQDALLASENDVEDDHKKDKGIIESVPTAASSAEVGAAVDTFTMVPETTGPHLCVSVVGDAVLLSQATCNEQQQQQQPPPPPPPPPPTEVNLTLTHADTPDMWAAEDITGATSSAVDVTMDQHQEGDDDTLLLLDLDAVASRVMSFTSPRTDALEDDGNDEEAYCPRVEGTHQEEEEEEERAEYEHHQQQQLQSQNEHQCVAAVGITQEEDTRVYVETSEANCDDDDDVVSAAPELPYLTPMSLITYAWEAIAPQSEWQELPQQQTCAAAAVEAKFVTRRRQMVTASATRQTVVHPEERFHHTHQRPASAVLAVAETSFGVRSSSPQVESRLPTAGFPARSLHRRVGKRPAPTAEKKR